MSRKPNPAPKTVRRATPQERADGWKSTLTGVGTVRDKRTSHRPTSPDVQWQEGLELWRGNDVAARAVEMIPFELLRTGFEITIAEGKTAGGAYKAPEVDKKAAPVGTRTDAFPPNAGKANGSGAPIMVAPPPKPKPQPIEPRDVEQAIIAASMIRRWDDLDATRRFYDALCYSRALGGGAILMGVDDGAANLSEPLNYDTIKSVKWLTLLERREFFASAWYGDPREAMYGQPKLWRLQPTPVPNGDVASAFLDIHESRMLVFPGRYLTVTERVQQLGHGHTIFERIRDVIRDVGLAWESTGGILVDFAQAVIKIKGLSELIAANGSAAVKARLEAIDMSRSVVRAVLVDAEGEDFERKTTSITGLPEILQMYMYRVAAAVETPVTKFWGMSPAGLSATGASDMRNWYDTLHATWNLIVKPHIQRLLRVLFRSADSPTNGKEPEDWTLEQCPLWQPTDTEKADVRLKQSQADVAYVGAGVATPEEIASSRFGGPKYSTDTVIDFDGRAQMAADQEAADAEHEAEMIAAAENTSKPATVPPV